MVNDPKVKKRADITLEWEDVSLKNEGDITKNPQIRKIVTDTLTQIGIIKEKSIIDNYRS